MNNLVNPRALAIVFVLPTELTLLDQAPSVPPGPPGPTVKTLQQVEPRIPVSSLPITLSQPGSYYLTTNLQGIAGQHGITINGPRVTLDLMGFELRGVPGSLSAILL